MRRTPLLVTLFALFTLGACGDKDDTAPPVEGDTDTDTDADSDTDADTDADADTDSDTDLDPNTVYVDGDTARSADPLEGGAAGILCLAVVSECPSMSNMGEIVGYDGEVVGDVDLTEPDASVPFSVSFDAEGMEAGTTYAINGYLETDADECDEDGPSFGELVTFGDTACPTFVWTPGERVNDVAMDLNFAMPFETGGGGLDG